MKIWYLAKIVRAEGNENHNKILTNWLNLRHTTLENGIWGNFEDEYS